VEVGVQGFAQPVLVDYPAAHQSLPALPYLKVSKFQNEFIESSFLPKYEPKLVSISAL
jgi:hypothetical protein